MWWVPIVVAVISGPIMFMLHRLDRNNTKQHGDNMRVIRDIGNDVRDVKADVRDVKADHRQTAAKVDSLAKDFQQHIGGG